MLFFREYFGAALTVRIYKKFGSGAMDIAKSNPYRLCDEVEGIGFEKADRFASSLGVDPESGERLMSGVAYILSSNAAQNGHVCLPRDKLVPAAAQLLRTDAGKIDRAVAAQLKAGKLVCRRFSGVDYLYTAADDRTEQYIADKLRLLDRLCPAVDGGDVQSFIRREEQEVGMSYATGQKKAIFDALCHGVMILTGGPGTGKTTVVHALIRIFDSMGMKIALAAPTGRAAKRLSESTACEAKTIHRLLEMSFDEDGGRGGFRRNEQDLLEEEVIIIDEASMVDSMLMAALLRAVKPGARLILIGDADQLPSVGAGRVLNDLIDSGSFATVRLEEIFRQSQASLIVTNAHAINRGEMPVLTDRRNDFFFLPRRTDAEISATIVELYKTRLPRTYGQLTENGIQIITPSRRGEAGTEHLNRLLQAALNPAERGRAEMSFRDKLFRVGDRVMQTRNNYDVLWEDDETDEADVPEPEDVSPGRGRARPPQVAGREWDEEPDSERRLRAATIEAQKRTCSKTGNMCAEGSAMLLQLKALVPELSDETIADAVAKTASAYDIVRQGRYYYDKTDFIAERGMAAKVAALANEMPTKEKEIENAFIEWQKENSIILSPRQAEAVRNLKYRISIVTGGPGTGKTTCLLRVSKSSY